MPQNDMTTLVTIFPDWLKTITMLVIAMVTSAIVTLSKSKASSGAFKITIWFANIGIAMVMAFLVDSLALWIQPDINIKAEMALMVVAGVTAKDLLELAEKRGMSFFRSRADAIAEEKNDNA